MRGVTAAGVSEIENAGDRLLVQVDHPRKIIEGAHLPGCVQMPRDLIKVVANRVQLAHQCGGFRIAADTRNDGRVTTEQQFAYCNTWLGALQTRGLVED